MVLAAITHSLKVEIQSHQDGLKVASALVGTVGAIYALWGKQVCIAFTLVAIPSSFLLKKPITLFLNYQPEALAIAALALGASVLCFVNRTTAFIAMVGVAVTILRREWIAADQAEAKQKEIETLRLDNESLKIESEKNKKKVEELNTCFEASVDIANKVEQIVDPHRKTSAAIQSLDQKLDKDIARLSEKINLINHVFNQVIAQEHLMDRMKVMNQIEANIKKLTEERADREKEFESIMAQLRPAREELGQVTRRLLELEHQQLENLSKMKSVVTKLEGGL